MDKTTTLHTKVKYKQGFALMITLSVLAVIIALTMVLLSYFEEVQQDASDTKAMIQADIFYSDITATFKRFKTNQKALFSKLYKSPLSLRTPDGRFSLNTTCKPLSNGLNINWLGMGNNAKMGEAFNLAQDMFDALSEQYKIEEEDILLEMLLEEIGGKKKYVRKEHSRLRQKNGIISYKQFSRIVARYQLEVDDQKVSRVPWSKYFSFSRTATKVDAEYSSAELISFLFDIDLPTVRGWISSPPDEKMSLRAFVLDNSADYEGRKNIIAGKTFLAESQCDVSFKSGGGQYKFRFEYILGEAKHFEFYGKE
jgi:hypothetical protein